MLSLYYTTFFDNFSIIYIYLSRRFFKLTLSAFLYVFSAVIFVISALLFVAQAIYSLDFRKKIALTHGFSEAMAVGPYYPLLIISFSLIFIQFVSFVAMGFGSEFNIISRIFIYVSTFVLFLYFRYRTAPLLTYWLGKTCLWRKAGQSGKIPFSEIVGIQLSKNVVFPIADTQKLCKITFPRELMILLIVNGIENKKPSFTTLRSIRPVCREI